MRVQIAWTALVLLACAGDPGVVAEDAHEAEAAILEATLRYEAVQFTSREDQDAIVCVGLDRSLGELADPDRAFLRRLKDRPEVRARSECTEAERGAFETKTGKRAVVLGAGPVEWQADDEAHVKGYYFRSEFGTARPVYRAVKESGRWVILGPFLPQVD